MASSGRQAKFITSENLQYSNLESLVNVSVTQITAQVKPLTEVYNAFRVQTQNPLSLL